MLSPVKKSDRGELRKYDIIEGVIQSNLGTVKAALADDPECVNDVHSPSGMNAAMLCAQSRMLTFLNEILAFAQYQSLEHRDAEGRDLLEIAFSSRDPEIMSAVEEVFVQHAPHIVNNWPEP